MQIMSHLILRQYRQGLTPDGLISIKVASSLGCRGESEFTQFESWHIAITGPGSGDPTKCTQLLIYGSLFPFHFLS